MELHPYLLFDGNAREALAFYAETFGKPVPEAMTFGAMPDQSWVTDANRDRIAHVSLELGNVRLMISDTAGAEPFGGHAGMSISVMMDTVEEGAALMARLSEGGEITMPFAPTFWAKGFGACKDRFGVSWMVDVE